MGATQTTTQASPPVQTLEEFKQEFQRQLELGSTEQQRLEKLMMRKSMAKMSSKKRERLIRRHHAALTQADQARTLIQNVEDKLNGM